MFTPHYARPLMRTVTKGAVLREAPSDDASRIAQLVEGEEFAWLDTTAGWSWGYRRADHRVGYLRAECLLHP